MSRVNALRQKIASGNAVIGPILQEIPASPDLVEFIGAAGFDFVIIDGEHGGADTATVRELTRAADAVGITALARVPDADPGRILAFLDQGVMGIVLAHCNTAEDAEALVSAVKYPPRGIRGAASGSRAARFGYNQGSIRHIEIADEQTMALGLVEERRAMDNVPAMLAVDGFDGCFIGPGDLALSMDRAYLGQTPLHPAVQALVDTARDQCLAAGKLAMTPAGTGVAAKALIDQRYQMVCVQFGQFFRNAMNAYLEVARG
jgi:4-hydroxy-2-oxoheptanedioate aldolase